MSFTGSPLIIKIENFPKMCILTLISTGCSWQAFKSQLFSRILGKFDGILNYKINLHQENIGFSWVYEAKPAF